MSDSTRPMWEEQPDGTRVRVANGIRIVDSRGANTQTSGIEHLVTWEEEGGRTVILGLDAACKPVYSTTLYRYH